MLRDGKGTFPGKPFRAMDVKVCEKYVPCPRGPVRDGLDPAGSMSGPYSGLPVARRA